MSRYARSKNSAARRPQSVVLPLALLGLVAILARPASAQTPNFVDIVSGSSSGSGTRNLTTDTNGTFTYSNSNLVGSFSTSYDLTNHIFGTVSTPSVTGYSTTPSVCTDSTLISYTGLVSGTDPKGNSLQSQLVSSYTNESNSSSDAVGYYKDTITFSTSATSGYAYQIVGLVDSDNEVQDVILDYGTANQQVLALSALNGTEIRTTNNAKSNAYFDSKTNLALTNGTHTLSIIYYNNVGPSDLSFGFGYNALPEPGAVALLLGGLPAVGMIVRRRKK